MDQLKQLYGTSQYPRNGWFIKKGTVGCFHSRKPNQAKICAVTHELTFDLAVVVCSKLAKVQIRFRSLKSCEEILEHVSAHGTCMSHTRVFNQLI